METSGLDNEPKDGVLQLFPDLVPPEALRDLDGFDYLWCIFFCHLNAMNMDSSSGVNTGWNAMTGHLSSISNLTFERMMQCLKLVLDGWKR
eukprot:gene20921-25093_t